jgi:hypothetical protein
MFSDQDLDIMGNCVHSIQQRIELSRKRIEEASEHKIDVHQKAAEEEIVSRLRDIETAMRKGTANLKQMAVDIKFVESQQSLSLEDKTNLLFPTVATQKREQRRMTDLQKRYARALLRREVVYNTECDIKEVRSDGRIASQMVHMGSVAEDAIKDMDINADVKDKIQDLADALQEDDNALSEESKTAHADVMKDVTTLLAANAASAAVKALPQPVSVQPAQKKKKEPAYAKGFGRSLQLTHA